MAFSGDHPPVGQPHPWTDPFAQPDIFNPRPDWAFHEAGALAPRPGDFPLTDSGRQAYYDAAELVAREQIAMRHQMTMHQYLAKQQEYAMQESAAIEGAKNLREHLLLLRR
jgi:hypothetical protein